MSVLIEQSIEKLKKLPEQKLKEVAEFIDFITQKMEDEIELQEGIQKVISGSKAFAFLQDENDLYSDEKNTNSK